VRTWVWRVTLAGYVLACAGVVVDYWTQWTGNYNLLFQVGWIMTVPAFLLTMVGSTVLGLTLLVRGSAPRLPALLLALVIPLAWLILQATSLGSAVLPVMFAFGILGHQLASASAVADLPAAETPARYCLDRSLQTPDPQAWFSRSGRGEGAECLAMPEPISAPPGCSAGRRAATWPAVANVWLLWVVDVQPRQ
jgi:hypothetical protein